MPTPTALHEIPLVLIDIGDQQLRADPEDEGVVELAADIAHRGLLQPVGVYETKAGRYQLLFGSRRLAAHKRLRARTIRAQIFDPPEDGIRITAIVENLHRANLTLKEECDAVTHLHTRENKSPDSIAAQLSKSRQWVLRRLAVDSFHPDCRNAVLDGRLALGSAEIITQLEDDGARNYLLSETLAGRLTTAQVHAMAETLRTIPTTEPAVQAGVNVFLQNQQTPIVTLECEACRTRRPMAELRIVRVCAEGCEQDADHDNTKH